MKMIIRGQEDMTKQLSDALYTLKLSRSQKQFVASVRHYSLQHIVTDKQIAAVNKIVSKAATKIRCEDAPCCGCC
jgi:hypothetical protein